MIKKIGIFSLAVLLTGAIFGIVANEASAFEFVENSADVTFERSGQAHSPIVKLVSLLYRTTGGSDWELLDQ